MSCCKHLSVRVFVPEISSWSGNNNSCIYLLSKCYSAFWQESPLGMTVTLSEVQNLAEQQISAGGSLRTRSQTLPSCHFWGSWAPRTQLALGLLRPHTQQGQVKQTAPYTDGYCLRLQKQGRGQGSLLPQGLDPASWQTWQGLWSPKEHRPQPVPWDPGSTAGQDQVSWRVLGEGGDLLPTSLCLMTTTLLTTGWMAQ